MTTESHEGRVEAIPAGYIADFISRLPVRATAEEVDAVQVFSRRLVEDLGYSREQVQTRPQHRLRIRPSDSPGSYPVDIAVFAGESRNEEDLVLRAVSTSLRQPGSAFTVATPRHRRGATTTDRAAVWAGQRPYAGSRPGCRSSVLGHPGGSFSTAD